MPDPRLLTACRVCDGARLEPAVDLGGQPWCNHFLRPEEAGSEPVFPLRVVYCHDCGTMQLDYTVPKELMFGDHTYLSGTTRSLRAHFAEVAAKVDATWVGERAGKSVLDIGSNDGTQLQEFATLGYEVLGVESSTTTAAIAQANGVPTVHAFFNADLARQLDRRFDVINAAGVFFHLEELHSVTDGIRACLAPDGVFCVQFLYMKRIVENLAFDQIYHEHLLYYTLRSLGKLLARHGLALCDAYLAPIHGGSMIAYATHAGAREPSEQLRAFLAAEDAVGANELAWYQRFAQRIERKRAEELAWLDATKAAGKRIFGMGAPAKGNTLLNYFGVGSQYLDCLAERNPLRKGLVSPGMHLPIVMEDEVEPPDAWYVLAWNFKREILANNAAQLAAGVEFHFPVDPDHEGEA